ncbi:hypothetical protein [Marinimicrobium alkaliphilum]|uniref:hypothetical protein n=1 Tax=Marinimicrobium alkaliphilum TaxID=2202654 RepID=UPI000DBAB6C3|nr:hypothetical protein [Marinimicrobium alkaliphilum]
MSTLVIILGVIILLLGIALLIKPGPTFAFIDEYSDTAALFYAAVGSRVFLGLVLLLAASESRIPGLFQLLGVLAIVAGTGVALMGQERFARLMDQVLGWPLLAKKAIGVLWIVLGALLIYVGL